MRAARSGVLRGDWVEEHSAGLGLGRGRCGFGRARSQSNNGLGRRTGDHVQLRCLTAALRRHSQLAEYGLQPRAGAEELRRPKLGHPEGRTHDRC